MLRKVGFTLTKRQAPRMSPKSGPMIPSAERSEVSSKLMNEASLTANLLRTKELNFSTAELVSSTPNLNEQIISDESDKNGNGASKKWKGFINEWITNLDKEIHVPGYQFCGPGTKVLERINRGERGINPLDNACMEHDLCYEMYKDLRRRHMGDRILAQKAWRRVKASDAKIGERCVALGVTVVMEIKMKLGL